MNPILHIEGLHKTFVLYQQRQKTIAGCRGVDLVLGRGEFAGITGKSGAGKSTILKCIYRTYLTNGGSIWFDSARFGRLDLAQATEQQVLAVRREEIGYVSQFLKVLPRVTALEVVMEALTESGCDAGQAREAARGMLDFFKLPEKLWDAYPNTFSGGEKLRLNLAKSMVKRPGLLLLDEPTASLDDASKLLVQDMILSLKREGVSMIGIFHDLDFMDRIVDTRYAMAEGLLVRKAAV